MILFLQKLVLFILFFIFYGDFVTCLKRAHK